MVNTYYIIPELNNPAIRNELLGDNQFYHDVSAIIFGYSHSATVPTYTERLQEATKLPEQFVELIADYQPTVRYPFLGELKVFTEQYLSEEWRESCELDDRDKVFPFIWYLTANWAVAYVVERKLYRYVHEASVKLEDACANGTTLSHMYTFQNPSEEHARNEDGGRIYDMPVYSPYSVTGFLKRWNPYDHFEVFDSEINSDEDEDALTDSSSEEHSVIDLTHE